MLPPHPDPLHLLALYGAALVLLGVLERRRLSVVLSRVGRPVAYFVTVSVVILVLCQAYLPGRAFYPWAAWTMYSDPDPSRELQVFQVERESGARQRLSTRRILRGPNVRPMMRHLTSRVDDESSSELLQILDALVALDGQRTPADPIVRIVLERCEISGSPPWTRSDLMCVPIGLEWPQPPEAPDAP